MDVARHGDRSGDRQYAGLRPRPRHRPQRAVGGRDRDHQRGQEGQGGRRRRQADDGQDARPDRGHPPAARRRHRRHRRRRADDQALHPQGARRQDARLALPGNRDLRAVRLDFGRAPRDPRRRLERRRQRGLPDRGADGGRDRRRHAGDRSRSDRWSSISAAARPKSRCCRCAASPTPPRSASAATRWTKRSAPTSAATTTS